MILPLGIDEEGKYWLQMHIHADLHNVLVCDIQRPQRRNEPAILVSPILVPHPETREKVHLPFGWLHERAFPASCVFMRSLYEKALMARKQRGHEAKLQAPNSNEMCAAPKS
eukprot:1639804-Amphidinium_carterae.1